MMITQHIKNINSEKIISKTLSFSKRVINYFPARLMIVAFFVSYFFLNGYTSIQIFEKNILNGIFHSVFIPSFYSSGELYVGNVYKHIKFVPQVYTQSMYLIFLISLAIAAKTSIEIRLKLLAFAIALFPIYIAAQFLTVTTLLLIGVTAASSYVAISVITTGLLAGVVIETAFFKTITLPKKSRIKAIIKRTYFSEYLYLIILLSGALIIIFYIMSFLKIEDDSLVSAYVSANFYTILVFKYVLSYFLQEVRVPDFVKIRKTNADIPKSPITFLLPAYNEGKTIERLLKTVDIAASKYPGVVEIILVNDGSTDNTGELARKTALGLKHVVYKQFDTLNRGKGAALRFGLEHSSGETIFRVDADSVVHPNCISPVMEHFRDPKVGSVSGMLFPISQKTAWQKMMVLFGCLFLYYRRAQELIDSVIVQPGAFSVFRKEALIRSGGWVDDQFGEDGELTVRLARYGYRHEFEERAIVYSDATENLAELRSQRLRWCIAYYHSRAKNIEVIKDFKGPRSFMVVFNILMHGTSFAHSIFWPILIMAFILNTTHLTLASFTGLFGIPAKIVIIQVIVLCFEFSIYFYFLVKLKLFHYAKYIPIMSVYAILLSNFIKPEALGILLNFSGKYKKLTRETNLILAKGLKKGF